ncbi:Fic family protein [Treponema putidum]|uniref:Fic family protein n=1 Tax=Treponema putidum TaxID=221027 RepID=UPI003D938C9E
MSQTNEQQVFNQLAEVIDEYNSMHIAHQLDYDKFYLYSIITHSTAIEGSTVTEIENQLLFDEGISANKPIYEQLMNLDLKAAYERSFELVKQHTQITPGILCELSSLVMKNTGSVYNTIGGTFSSAKGELRLLNVSAGRGGKSYTAWQKLPQKLEEFCSWLNAELKTIAEKPIQKQYAFSFLVHYKLVQIHPWADGNGRMSRLLMNVIQYEAGIIPSIIKKENRAEYIHSLASSQDKDDPAEFLHFMFSHHIRNLSEQIEEYKTSLEMSGS